MHMPEESTPSFNEIQNSNKFALVVGVNRCTSTYLSELKMAEYDAQKIGLALGQRSCNFTVTLLTGENAKTGDVRANMIKLVQQQTEKAFLLFYFIGHGQPMRTKDGRRDVYFVTHDFDPHAVKVDPTMHLSMRWLRDTLYEIDSVGSVLIVLDCCYAGDMITPQAQADHIHVDIDVRSIVNEVVDEHLEGTHAPQRKDRLHVILTSTRHNKQAQERVMTRLLYPALCGDEQDALDQSTGDVNIHTLYMYLQGRMSREDLPNLAGEFAGKWLSREIAS